MAKKVRPCDNLASVSLLTLSKRIGIALFEWLPHYLEVSEKACIALSEQFPMYMFEVKYGFFAGPVSPKFAALLSENDPIRHFFLVDKARTVVDPVRWVFEQVCPYIYAAQLNDSHYDIDGRARRSSSGVPEPFGFKVPIDLSFMSPDLRINVQRSLIFPKVVDASTLSWLAKQKMNTQFKKDLYESLMMNGLSDLIDRDSAKELGLIEDPEPKNRECAASLELEESCTSIS